MICKGPVRSEALTLTFRNCWLVITFSPASKKCKPLLEGGGGKDRGTYDRKSCSKK